MNKKIIAIASIVLVFALGFLYLNSGMLIAGSNGGNKCCINKTSSVSNTNKDTEVKDKSMECPGSSGCTKEGCTKEKMDAMQKSGSNMQCPKGGCNMKNKKTTGKDI